MADLDDPFEPDNEAPIGPPESNREPIEPEQDIPLPEPEKVSQEKAIQDAIDEAIRVAEGAAAKARELDDDVANIREQHDQLDERVSLNDNNDRDVEWSVPNYGIWLDGGTGGGLFTGIAYIYGRKYTGLDNPNLAFVKVNLATGQPTESAGPAPDPMPPNEEWFVKSEESGPIRIVNQ